MNERERVGDPNQAAAHRAGRLQEWRDGWRLVVACFAGAVIAGVPTNTVGVFMRPLGETFGWTRAEMSAAVPINGWLIALTAPFIGALIDRVGARRVGLVGCVVLPAAVGCLALIQNSIWTYWTGWLLIAVAQIPANILIWTMPVAGRFVRNRGLALAVVLMGNSTVGIFYPPVATLMIAHLGWRIAYALTGIGLFLLCMPFIWLFLYDWRDLSRRGIGNGGAADRTLRDPALQSGMTAREAMRTRQFWQLMAAVVLGGGGAVTMFIHIIPLSTSVGLTPMQAASAASALGLATLAAKIVAGSLVDRMSAPLLAAVTMLCPVVSCLIFMDARALGPGWALFAAALVGLGTGAELDMLGVLAARMFGVRHYGRIYGMALAGYQLAIGAGPLLVGISYDRAQSYHPALVGLIVCLLISAILFATLGRSALERSPERFVLH